MEPIETARIAEKIRRLLALSKSSNEHEAAAAAAKAQDLLHRYNLSVDQVDAAQRPDYGREIVDIGNNAGWRGVLLHVIATPNTAQVISLGGGRYAVIGQPHTIEVVRYLYEYLSREIERLADSAWKHFTGYAPSQRRWKTGFRFGAVDTIGKRLAAQRSEHKAEGEQSRALIVRDEAALRAAVAKYYPRTQSRSMSPVNASGYHAGQQAGHSIGLNQGLATSGRRASSGLLR